jgi:4-amino-4-deoxy-L-arabinose transferase-like glycosyltransferase
MTSHRALAALVVSAMLLHGLLSLGGLARHPLWLDEAYAVTVARQAPGPAAIALASDTGPPLYYWILHVWIALFGDSERAVRALSILFGALTVPAAAALARRVSGARAGIAAAFLVAAAPIMVQFSQEARMYTLMALLATFSTERLLAWMIDGNRGALVAHGLLLPVAFYTHNWGLLLLPGSAAAVVALAAGGGEIRARWRGWAIAASLALLAYLPWLPVLKGQAGSHAYDYIGMVQKLPAWRLPFRSLALFASGVGTTGGEAKSLLPAPGGHVAAIAWTLLLVAACILPARRSARLALLLCGIVPLAAAAAYSGLVRPIYLAGRYELMVFPILTALGAAALSDLAPGRWLGWTAVVWTLLLCGLSLSYTSGVQRRFPEQPLASRLAPELQPGDRVVFTGLYRAAMEYYLRRSGAPFEAASFPPDAARHLGWYYDSLYDTADAGLALAARADCPPAMGRTWVVASRTETCMFLIDQLSRCAQVASPFQSQGPPWNALLLATPKHVAATSGAGGGGGS